MNGPVRGAVVLVHGLYLRGPAMWPLARRLRRAGFVCEILDHGSVGTEPARTLGRLAARAGRLARHGPVHLLGHSLGGLLALALAQREGGWGEGRILCLGAPIQGSAAAAALVRRGLGAVLGRAAPLLSAGVEPVAGAQVGMIAGTRALGLGHWLARLPVPHDGTVAVAETQHPLLAMHRCMPVSHTGLLLHAAVAAVACDFLAGAGQA
ncbi:MAG: hypothetical protein KatS3mg126_1198 [Lysobacteraceae bacterium]|nr:MAG: hypothetical protein KatS3mg126_1198 [Xanthomonadaceae bacterium]